MFRRIFCLSPEYVFLFARGIVLNELLDFFDLSNRSLCMYVWTSLISTDYG